MKSASSIKFSEVYVCGFFESLCSGYSPGQAVFQPERFQLVENLRSARCSSFVNFKVLAARMTKLITARARKNKRTARMLANARKDHSIPLL